MSMTNAQLEAKLRNDFLDVVRESLEKYFETDVLPVSASEVAIPAVDEEGNEKFVLVKVSIPRGTRDGNGGYDPYDGYAVAEAYKMESEEKAQKKAEAEAKKKAKIAKDQQKRAEKKALAEANKGLKELRKIKLKEPKQEEGE